MGWLVAVTYLATTTTRAKASFRSPGAALPCDETTRAKASFWPSGRRLLHLLGTGCCTFSGSGDVETIPAGVPASLERWVRMECGDSERGELQAQGPFICLDEKIIFHGHPDDLSI